jgi:flagellar hook-length control protein FliK
MNIMLTDLHSLTLDVQEIPAVVDSGADSFAGMFYQQFPEVVAEGDQMVEFKDYFENNPLQADTSAVALEVPPIPPWREPSTPIPGATDGASAVSLEHLNSLLAGPLKPDSELTAAAPLEMAAGELLPVGGNQLPLERPPGTVDPGMLERSVEAPMTTAITPPVITPVDVAAIQSQPTAEMLTRSAAVQPDTKILQQVNPAIVPADVDPVILKEKVAPAESILTVARATPVEIRPATDSGRSGEAGAIGNLVAAAELSPSRPEVAPGSTPQSPAAPVIAGREFRLEEAPEIASRVVNNARESAAQVTSSAAEAAADRTILHRDNGLNSEPVVAREIISNIENRISELPVQNAANTSQQPGSGVTGSATVAPISGATNVTPASQHNPLPPQLESMSLTRNADANEWSSGLSERINWMVNQKQNTATIRLDPPALGKLDVQIKIVDDATMITIQTQTAQTRDLIDSASIRLRDFLQESGYQNVNVDVSQRQDQQQARSQTTANMNPEQDDNSGQEQDADHRQQQQASYFTGEGLVDTFA